MFVKGIELLNTTSAHDFTLNVIVNIIIVNINSKYNNKGPV